jgi:hypothetical protein
LQLACELRDRGISMQVENGRLALAPASAITQRDLERILPRAGFIAALLPMMMTKGQVSEAERRQRIEGQEWLAERRKQGRS